MVEDVKKTKKKLRIMKRQFSETLRGVEDPWLESSILTQYEFLEKLYIRLLDKNYGKMPKS